MTQATLFPMPEVVQGPVVPAVAMPPRVQRADRAQVQLRPVNLDALLPDDHQARAVWAYVEAMDLSGVYQKIKALEGSAGRPAIDPKILTALWLYATIRGVGSARALDRLCVEHVAFQWICGGVSVNYHTLGDFRVGHPEVLNGLLTQGVAVLEYEGLVDLQRVAQDGVRVRASAGAASFRREKTLLECLEEAREQVEVLHRELEEDPAKTTRRQQAARLRAKEERASRIAEALRQLPDLQAKKKPDEKSEARVSTTDADARVMKMPDGGFRPAFNVQFGSDTKSQLVVGVDVNNVGVDAGQLEPMAEQVVERYNKAPGEMLVDGGYVKFTDIEKVSAPPIASVVYAPVPKPRNPTRDRFAPCEGDSPAIAEWRARMGTEQAKAIYKERAATAECVNAIARNRGLRQFLVRGLARVKAVVLWFALAHNLVRTITLRAEAALRSASLATAAA